jgi:hypothetical protein
MGRVCPLRDAMAKMVCRKLPRRSGRRGNSWEENQSLWNASDVSDSLACDRRVRDVEAKVRCSLVNDGGRAQAQSRSLQVLCGPSLLAM